MCAGLDTQRARADKARWNLLVDLLATYSCHHLHIYSLLSGMLQILGYYLLGM
jgi:hypothetical protein